MARARGGALSPATSAAVVLAMLLALIVPVALAGPASAANGTLSGTVFNDTDVDGTFDGTESGVAGAVVRAYDTAGNQFTSAATGSNGQWTISLSGATAGAVRVELQTIPTGYQPTIAGTDNQSTVRFTTFTDGGSVTNLRFGVQRPGEFCQNNPDIATTVFCVGNGSAANSSDLHNVFHSTYDSQTRTGAGLASTVGSVDGVAWDPVTRKVFISAYVKRHAGLVDAYGADALFVLNPATNVTTHWVDLATLGIDVGQGSIPANAARDITSASVYSADPIFDEVGKYGIGDIETNGRDTLYVMNLFQRTVHAIPIPADGSAPTSASSLGSPASAITCTNGTARPFALAYQDGYLYAGIVCDAASGSTANLDAYVVRTTGDGTWTAVDLNGAAAGNQLDLDYDKGATYSAAAASPSSAMNKWHVWDDTFDSGWDAGQNSSTNVNLWGFTNANSDFVIRPTPMLSDIDFDDDGSIVLAFRDRTADMIGADNAPPLAADRGTPAFNVQEGLVMAMAGGDLLRICLVSGSFVVDGATGCANHNADGSVGNNGQGPNGGEYYPGETNGAHEETSQGHVAIAPRSGQLLLASMNAEQDTFNSGGVRGVSNSTGAYIDSLSANYFGQSDRPGNGGARFAKANGMGDIEVLCDAAPLEIGNRVWRDDNNNGIQDPAEPGINGVTVQLFAASNLTTPVGTAVTSGTGTAAGSYYFRTGVTESASGNGDNLGGGLDYRKAYVIRIGSTANYASGGVLDNMSLAKTDQSPSYTYAGSADTIDSDAPATGLPGDMGTGGGWFPSIAVTAGSTLPGYINHTYDAGFVPPQPYDLALRKTVVSMNGSPSAGSVTFALEVFNQSATAVEDVTVTDYISTASFNALASAPAAGTTTGSAALPYTWSITGGASGTKPQVTIDGVIPAGGSVVVQLTLTIAANPPMTGLTNRAEISRFDNDGNSGNGDSTSGAVYDVDSIPDTTDTDALVDDVINQQRWNNTATSSTENTGVQDEDDHDVATVPLYDLALIKVRAAGQAAVVTTPGSPAPGTANFDITVKNQGENPAFNVTVLDSPTAPLAINAATPASQSVTSALGAATTVTYAGGVFTIPTLAKGDSVTFRVVTTLSMVNTVQVNTAEITGFDNDSNASNAKPSWVQDVDSTPDSNPGNDVREVVSGSTFPQDSHNQIDRAPVNGANPDDEDDHDSEAVQLGLLRIGSTVYKDANGNDIGDAGEEVPGVLVQLFRLDGGSWVLAGETVTNAGGDYSFDQLFPGTYQVGIPATQSHGSLGGINPTALSEWEPVAGSVAGPETSNFDNDGDAESGFISRSDNIVLTYGSEPTNDDADDADADSLTSPRTYADENSNLNIDFVFEQITYELGNLVWSDNGAGNHYNNGVADADESGLSGVTVELYRDNGAGLGEPNDGILHADERIATTVTGANGTYTFTGLTAGSDYYVVVVKSSVPKGFDVAGTPVLVSAADGVDNDNNAAIDAGFGWASGAIALGPVASPEPTGETDGTTGAAAAPAASVPDARADQTVDFGFVPSVRIGNQVWRDESDSSVTTEVSTDNNGIFDPASGEAGLTGVTVELWADDGDGVFERVGDTLIDSTTTDAEGNYWFEGVRPGLPYFVVVPSIGAVGIDRPASSTGQSAGVAAADNDDDGAPVGTDLSVSRVFTPTLGSASLGEADANPAGDGSAETEANAAGTAYDDNDSELRVDFGFVSVPLYRVGNLVWLDNGGTPHTAANEANGLANDGETGIAGITVQLHDASDTDFNAAIATAVTDANGHYAFESLVPGDYVLYIPNTGANATLLAGLVSTADGVSADADVDNDDNGAPVSGGWASDAVTLGAANAYMGAEPTDERLRADDATGDDNGLSWTASTADPAVYANSRSNFTVDFGFTPVYRVGNLVWLDLNNDGIAQDGEPGLAGVTVELVDVATGTAVDSTTTSGDGHYAFGDLAAGDYGIRVVPSTLPSHVVPSGSPVGDANGDIDNDTNAATPPVLGSYSATVTLGGGEPTTETLREDDATDDDADGFADSSSNYTVDFGFWPQLRIGNVVWIDESDNDPATYAATDNNGVVDAGETPLAGVTVTVWADGGDGVFDGGTGAGDDVFAGSDVTDSEGNWVVATLAPGTYFAAIQALPSGYESYVSTAGQVSGDDDNEDHGAAAVDGVGTAFVAASQAVELTAGGEPAGEVDTLPAADGSAEVEADAATHTVRDLDSNLTVDFGFVATPHYRVGNLVWMDSNRDGVAQAGEPGISGVLVQLLDSTGTVIAETVTDANGRYDFTEDVSGNALAAGDYRVRIPGAQVAVLGGSLPAAIQATALSNLSATAAAGDPDVDADDNDSNGVTGAEGWTSAPLTLGGDPLTFESEPTTETLRVNDAADDDLGWTGGTDARSNVTVDFGFFPGLRLGDTVWYDNGRTGIGTFNVANDNDGIYQATELPAAGVTVQLFADDGDGVFEPGVGAGQDGAAIQTTVTDAAGEYFFVGLDEGTDYWVGIPDSELGSGQELAGLRASTPVWADGAGTNDRNHGTAAAGFASVSGLIDLGRGTMGYGESADEPNANTKSGVSLTDGDSNLVIDFGFSPAPQYRIGNLVWLDADEDGLVGSGESALASITVQLFTDDGDGVFEPGAGAGRDGAPVTTTTDAFGRYGFDGLAAGSYWVHIPAQSGLEGLDSSEIREGNANGDVDNDNNAVPNATDGGWTAGLVELGAIGVVGENGEPTGEADGNTGASAEGGAYFDSRSNQTVDFGFNYRLRVGNQVWLDESAAAPGTHVSTDNNGVFDSGEVGIVGVPVELWFDVNGNGFQGAASDDTLVASTFTNGEGNYWFDGIIADEKFYIAIPASGFPMSDVRSSAPQSSVSLGTDNDDDGATAGAYLAVSRMLDLQAGSALLGETDTVEPGDGSGGAADASAEAEANLATGAYRDSDSYLSVDFGFINVPLYRIGNLVWLDTDNDGIAETGENGLPGVLVQLLNSGGTVIAETVTDSDGHYAFENLVAGDYSVRIPADQTETLGGSLPINTAALDNLATSANAVTNANGDVDNDHNGVGGLLGWTSGVVTLGSADDAVTETEPTNERLRSGSATDDDSGWVGGTDARSNVSVDFGFYQLLRLGDIVWLDNGGNGGAYVASREDDGRFADGFEDLLDGVTVTLFADDGDSVFEPGAGDTVVGTTETSGGRYYFTGLTEGTYFAAIPASELGAGQELFGLRSSTGQAVDFAANDRDQGAPVAGYAAVTKPIVMKAGAMVNGDTAFEAMADAITGVTVPNRSSNLAVDFGFSPTPTYALGNLVWEDLNNDGTVDAGEPGIGSVTVRVFADDGDGVFDASTDTLVGTDTTGTAGADAGRYLFEGLPAGDYFVHVPSQAGLTDWFVGGTPTSADDTDNDNNALTDAVDGWTSPLVSLGGAAGPADHDEPTGETDANTSADAEAPVATRDDRSNQTIDFGYWRGLRLGNQVWRDESDGDPATSVATDNNGDFDGGERGIAGVTVELWRDVSGDGFEGASSDDVLLATDVTDAEGNYVFEHLAAGGDYYVVIQSVGSPFSTARSSGGQSAAFDSADNDDDGAPLAGYLAVSKEITLTVGGAATGETDTVEPGDGSAGPGDASAEAEANAVTGAYPDSSSYLTADFGFVEVPLYRVGNLVWLDADNDGIAENGEQPLTDVLVQLFNGTGTLIAETTTDSDGHYAFENLAAGEYTVRVPENQSQLLGGSLFIDTTALDNLASSTVDSYIADDDVDNDDNGVTGLGGWTSSQVTLGSGDDSVTETEPTNERLRSGSATDDDSGWAGGTDARSNVSVDFGFYQLLRLGDIVWLDNGGNGGGYVPADEDNGVWDAQESLIDKVSVRLYRDNGDGVFDLGTDTFVADTTTDAGIYYFTGLTEGDYFVAIPVSEQDSGEELFNLRSSTGRAADDSVNSQDQGEPVTGYAAVSSLIELRAGAMSNGDSADESRADSETGVTVADASSNLAIDFGFSPVPGYALGNLVWEDLNNDGTVDAGEPGIGSVTVRVFADDGDGVFDAFTDTLVGTDTTGTAGADAGRYLFEGLPAGDYFVHVPSQAGLTDWFVGGTPTSADDTDNDNNALTDAVDGWTSPLVSLGGAAGPADHDEPTGETDANTSADAEAPVATRDDRSNQTIDFGYWRGLRLGNQVWLDEGAAGNQDNGIYDADETPIAGLDIELWLDNGDDVFNSGDVEVGTTTTDLAGRYFFTGLAEGTYFVAIPSAGGASSTGTVGSGLADDGEDDGSPSTGYDAVSGPLELSLGSAPVGEIDGPGAGGGSAEDYANTATAAYPDASSFLTADFGFIEVPLYRIGNLVWLDTDNDGVAESGEPGVPGVLVQLTDASGTVLAETVTDADGHYLFAGLAAGTYRVQVPTAQSPVDAGLVASIDATALAGLYPSTTVNSSPDGDQDNDANGIEVTFGAQSNVITLGGTEPVTETLRADDSTDDDAGQVSPRIDDDRSNVTLDFGYYGISLGNQVFFDANGNGVFEPADGDDGIANVTVQLMDMGGAVVSSTTTDGDGLYLFTGLREGERYYLEIPATEFVSGDLVGLFSSPGDAGDVASDDTDGRDRGVDPAVAYGAVRSAGLVVASASGSPITDGTGDNPDNDSIRTDAAENLVVDFGFTALEVGGTLFLDDDNDGIDTDAGDFAGVTVELLHGDGSPYLLPSGAAYTTVTDANGDYRFTGLPEGTYVVRIPASQFASGAVLEEYANSDGNDPVPSPDNDVTGEDNGYVDSGDIFAGEPVLSLVVTLTVASEPSDDPTPSTDYQDAMSNLSVDFGFWNAQGALELGNQLWFDTVRNGVFDASELPVPAGVKLELRDADTDALIDSTFTDAAGKYLFRGLKAGRYVIVVTADNFQPGKPLAGWTSTDGAGVSSDPNDELDSDSNALPLSATGVRSGLLVLFAATPTGEVDPASIGLDDRQSNLTVDFGFVRAPVLVFTGADAEGALKSSLALLALGAMLFIGSRRRKAAPEA